MNGYFSEHIEDRYRLPEGMRRIAYDADTQRYTFRDRSGQLYQNAPGEEYGVLHPVATPLSHRRNVTITDIPDPALREWSRRQTSTNTFGDILPSSHIAAAPSAVRSLTSPSGRFVQAALPKVQGVLQIVRRHTTLRRPRFAAVSRSVPFLDEKQGLLEDGTWEIVHKEEIDGRLARSKSEMRPPGYYARA